MAAPETQVAGVNLLLKADTNQIGGQLDATLQRNANAIEILTKTAGYWGKSLNGVGEWSISADNAFTESDGSHVVGADSNAKLDITYDPGAGAQTETIPDLQTVTLELTSNLSNVGGLDDALWRFRRVTGQALQLDTSGVYVDPASTLGAAYGLLLDAQDAGDTVDYTLTFGSMSFSGTVTPGDWSLSAPSQNENATMDFNLRHEGTQSAPTSSIDTGLQALVDAFYNRNKVAALIEYQEGGSAVTGATKYEGDTWVESLTLEASREEILSFNAELAGEGALTRATQA